MLDIFLFLILVFTLLYASYSDIKTRNVSDWIHVAIILLAFVKVFNIFFTGGSSMQLINMAFGMMLGFLSMFFASCASNGRHGGADIKLMAACGLLIGFWHTAAALLICLFAEFVIFPAIAKIRHLDVKASFPLVPFLSAGVICSLLIFKLL